jgi:hypothetical protein
MVFRTLNNIVAINECYKLKPHWHSEYKLTSFKNCAKFSTYLYGFWRRLMKFLQELCCCSKVKFISLDECFLNILVSKISGSLNSPYVNQLLFTSEEAQNST